ncbi:MAG: hypothetical protein FWE18_00340 [Alphaproteobacteria bacterium]|nr:hypothetical protein [Alphaproteobacteria bacterium]
MILRFLFLIGVVFSLLIIAPHRAEARCDDDAGKEDALSTGNFISCGHNSAQQGYIAEFGNPQKPSDETDPNSPLTPIEPTDYNNLNPLNFSGNSNVKFHFYRFLNNAEINVSDNSILDIQLYNSNADLKFTVNPVEDPNNPPDTTDTSSIIYRGGTSGKVSVYLPVSCNLNKCFSTSSNIDYLNFQGYEGGSSTNNGGQITIGLNKDGREEKANVVINHIIGNGIIDINDGSKLTIKDYIIDDSNIENSSYYISEIKGGADSEVIFDTKIFTRALNVGKATFNYDSKIMSIQAQGGEYIFNASSDIGDVNALKTITINNNASVVVKNLYTIDEVNIKAGSTLEIQGGDKSSQNISTISKVQGEGTLYINPTNSQEGNNQSFKMTDVNFNTLVFNEGDLRINNDGNTDKITRRIKNIKRSDASRMGGTLIAEGAVVFDNVEYLNKLIICVADANNCQANLTLKKVQHLNELEINNGILRLEISNNNNDSNINSSAALTADTININGGELQAEIKDTTTIKNKNTYWVLNSQNLTVASLTDNVKTLLPSWYDKTYYLTGEADENGNIANYDNLMLTVERNHTYNDVVSKSDLSNKDVLKFASYFDSLIKSSTPLDISAKTLTYLDLFSDEDTLANNIQSLIPLSKNTYIKTAHASLKEALDVSKTKGISNRKPFGIWDKRQAAPAPEDNLWAVAFISDGEFNNADMKDSYKSQAGQFGYSFYNQVSPNNREGQTFYLVGGFSRGSINNNAQDTNISTFNTGGIFDYRDENDMLKFSLLYGYSSFDTNKSYFLSTADNMTDVLGDSGELSGGRLQSNPTTHEILLDMQYSKEIFIEYLSSFSQWSNTILTPKLFITPSLLVGNNYKQESEASSIKVGSYSTVILESGGGFGLSKEVNLNSNSRVKLAFDADVFYRYYNIPANAIGFAETSQTVSLGRENAYSGIVAAPMVSAFWIYQSSQLGSYYKREISSSHYQNIFGVSYKYSF